jgi:ABC-type transporter Mla subunit MlaD
MTQKANYFKLGLFVIIASVLGATFLMIFGAGEFLKKELYVETCFDESVQGLTIGSEVKYKGIKIGTVKSITSAARVYQTKSDYVLVILSLEDSISIGQTGESARARIQNAIKDGLKVSISYKGLTGAAYLETDYSVKEPDNTLDISWAPKNIYIPSRKSTMKQFSDTLSQILDNLATINMKEITQNIESLVKTMDQKINDFDMERISSLIVSLLRELENTNKKVNSAIESSKFKRLLDNVEVSFSELRTIVQTAKIPIKRAITDFQKAAGNTKDITAGLKIRLGPKIDDLSSNLDQLMESLAATSKLLENMIWLNSDRIKLIIGNIEITSENLKQMSKDIKKYPGRLLFEKPPEKINTKENK